MKCFLYFTVSGNHISGIEDGFSQKRSHKENDEACITI